MTDAMIRPKIKKRKYSRKGCKECKRRKIKCDEAAPACDNCTRLSKTCVYDIPPRYEDYEVKFAPYARLNVISPKEDKQPKVEKHLDTQKSSTNNTPKNGAKSAEMHMIGYYGPTQTVTPTEPQITSPGPLTSEDMQALLDEASLLVNDMYHVLDEPVAPPVRSSPGGSLDSAFRVDELAASMHEDAAVSPGGLGEYMQLLNLELVQRCIASNQLEEPHVTYLKTVTSTTLSYHLYPFALLIELNEVVKLLITYLVQCPYLLTSILAILATFQFNQTGGVAHDRARQKYIEVCFRLLSKAFSEHSAEAEGIHVPHPTGHTAMNMLTGIYPAGVQSSPFPLSAMSDNMPSMSAPIPASIPGQPLHGQPVHGQPTHHQMHGQPVHDPQIHQIHEQPTHNQSIGQPLGQPLGQPIGQPMSGHYISNPMTHAISGESVTLSSPTRAPVLPTTTIPLPPTPGLASNIEKLLLTVLVLTLYFTATTGDLHDSVLTLWRAHLRGARDLLVNYSRLVPAGSTMSSGLALAKCWFIAIESAAALHLSVGGTLGRGPPGDDDMYMRAPDTSPHDIFAETVLFEHHKSAAYHAALCRVNMVVSVPLLLDFNLYWGLSARMVKAMLALCGVLDAIRTRSLDRAPMRWIAHVMAMTDAAAADVIVPQVLMATFEVPRTLPAHPENAFPRPLLPASNWVMDEDDVGRHYYLWFDTSQQLHVDYVQLHVLVEPQLMGLPRTHPHVQAIVNKIWRGAFFIKSKALPQYASDIARVVVESDHYYLCLPLFDMRCIMVQSIFRILLGLVVEDNDFEKIELFFMGLVKLGNGSLLSLLDIVAGFKDARREHQRVNSGVDDEVYDYYDRLVDIPFA